MSNYVQTSKTIANCQITDGSFASFFNDTCIHSGTINWYNPSGEVVYTMVIPNNVSSSGYRALHWCRHFNTDNLDKQKRIVPFLRQEATESTEEGGDDGATPEVDFTLSSFGATAENSNNDDKTEETSVLPKINRTKTVGIANLLYESICPAISMIGGSSGINLVFWTNFNQGADVSTGTYDENTVFKASSFDYPSALRAGVTKKALCSANISFEQLRQDGGGFNDNKPIFIPVVKSVAILSYSDGAIFDFSGGGGGIGRHSHESNANSAGGFAYSVFAPGTSIKPISWT